MNDIPKRLKKPGAITDKQNGNQLRILKRAGSRRVKGTGDHELLGVQEVRPRGRGSKGGGVWSVPRVPKRWNRMRIRTEHIMRSRSHGLVVPAPEWLQAVQFLLQRTFRVQPDAVETVLRPAGLDFSRTSRISAHTYKNNKDIEILSAMFHVERLSG